MKREEYLTQPKYAMPTHCPVSGKPLEVTALRSPESGVSVEGRFQPNEFALLPPENLEFLRLFVKVRGNLKEMERIMGVSYPTIRHRFESLINVLGYELQAEESAGKATRRSVILEQLEKGELDADQAAKALQELRGG